MRFAQWWKHSKMPSSRRAPDNEAYLAARIAWNAAIAEAAATAARWNDGTDIAYADIVKAVRKLAARE